MRDRTNYTFMFGVTLDGLTHACCTSSNVFSEAQIPSVEKEVERWLARSYRIYGLIACNKSQIISVAHSDEAHLSHKNVNCIGCLSAADVEVLP